MDCCPVGIISFPPIVLILVYKYPPFFSDFNSYFYFNKLDFLLNERIFFIIFHNFFSLFGGDGEGGGGGEGGDRSTDYLHLLSSWGLDFPQKLRRALDLRRKLIRTLEM